MNSLTVRICTGIITFIVGVGVATAWVLKSNEARMDPVPLAPVSTVNDATLELVFVLDTTGSMGGLIDGAKQRIWGIVNEVMQSSSRPAVKIGLVAYRDRGDLYVTQILPLTNDLDKVYETLMNYEAGGGGDTPENVRRALADGLSKAGWSESSPKVAQIIFLVGDAPPHDDYSDEVDTQTTAAKAVAKGKIVNTIQCGAMPQTTPVWRAIAQAGQGQYFAIAQDGGVRSITTPYDEQLSQLSVTLSGTYVAYGGGAGEAGDASRGYATASIARTEKEVEARAPAAAKAERAMNKVFNATAYIGDLLQNIENGSVKLESVKEEDLPADLRKLSMEDRKLEVEKRLAERRDIRAKITALAKHRTEYIAAQRAKDGSKHDSFDVVVANALREQLARKGIK
jgi:Mg-chelatase subunit ChlD